MGYFNSATETRHPFITTLSFYFCDDFDNDSNKAKTIIGSLARQVLDSKAMEPSLNAYLAASSPLDVQDIAPDECIDLLVRIVPRQGWNGFFVIDGIDQCPENEASTTIRELARLSSEVDVKLLFSWRTNWTCFERNKGFVVENMSFQIFFMECMSREPEALRYIDQEMASWGEELVTLDVKQAISQRLILGWGNMFLWLVLQLQHIQEELRSGTNVVNILARLPDALSDVYEKVLLQVPARDHALTPAVLQLVAAADPPLTLKELRAAANIKLCDLRWAPEEMTAIPSAFCWRYGSYLLEVDEDDDKVRFIHPSVAMHLTKSTQSPQTKRLHFSLQEAQKRVGVACLTLFNLKDINMALRYAPVQYATSQPAAWVADCSKEESRMLRWLGSKYASIKGNTISPSQALNYTYGIATQAHRQSEPSDFFRYARTHWLDATRSLDLTPDEQALLEEVVQGSAPNGSMSENLRDPRTGILWAMTELHKPIFVRHYYDERLVEMALNPEYNERLANLLLVRWTELEAQGPLLLQCCEWVIQAQYRLPEDFMRVIQLIFPGLPSKESAGKANPSVPPLLAAQLLKYILSSKMNDQDFHFAIRRLVDCTEVRLSSDDLINVIQYRTPGRLKILLALGADPNQPGRNLPIITAFDLGNLEAVHLLCQYDVNVDVTDEHDRTCLMRAVQQQSLETVQMLLRHSMRFGRQDEAGRTAFHLAASSGQVEILKCMISELVVNDDQEASFVLNLTTSNHDTALFLALHNSHIDCAEIILSAGGRRLFVHQAESFYVAKANKNSSDQQRLRSIGRVLADMSNSQRAASVELLLGPYNDVDNGNGLSRLVSKGVIQHSHVLLKGWDGP